MKNSSLKISFATQILNLSLTDAIIPKAKKTPVKKSCEISTKIKSQETTKKIFFPSMKFSKIVSIINTKKQFTLLKSSKRKKLFAILSFTPLKSSGSKKASICFISSQKSKTKKISSIKIKMSLTFKAIQEAIKTFPAFTTESKFTSQFSKMTGFFSIGFASLFSKIKHSSSQEQVFRKKLSSLSSFFSNKSKKTPINLLKSLSLASITHFSSRLLVSSIF